ncbi:MAG: type III pantothenate kinase [Fibrobacter sp.]|nr:type III pantothenate kinase [Fibrobacter sp.]
MEPNSICLAIDTGNTRTHLGIIDKGKMACVKSISFYTCDISNKLVSSIEFMLKEQKSVSISETVIASVVKGTSSEIIDLLGGRFGTVSEVKFTKALSDCINYENRNVLGADRIADALYGCKFRPKGCIIIDAGTAIKTDIVVNSQFLGGSIIPGIQAQLTSLNHSTSFLPLVETFGQKYSLPGNSTVNCMVSGIMHGAAGALNNFVSIYKSKYSQDMPVLATGGSWDILAGLVNFEYSHVPDMTLIGISLYNAFCSKPTLTNSNQAMQTNLT